eukprot:6456819-Amphidinium_carterae.1
MCKEIILTGLPWIFVPIVPCIWVDNTTALQLCVVVQMRSVTRPSFQMTSNIAKEAQQRLRGLKSLFSSYHTQRRVAKTEVTTRFLPQASCHTVAQHGCF